MRKRKASRRRNPIARAVRKLKPTIEQSVKAYKRREKHRAHPDHIDRGGLVAFLRLGSRQRRGFGGCVYSAAWRRVCSRPSISRAALGMCVPGPNTATTPFSLRKA